MSKIQLQPHHKGVENVELFEKTRLNILRQSNMMWLEDNTNYNFGFNHAWVALQGAASENVVESIALKKANQRIQQLEAELATIQDEKKVESLLPETKEKATRTRKPKGTSDAKTSE